MLTRRHALILTAGGLGALALKPGFAMGKSPIYIKDGVALGGTDPVAYFTQSAVVPGVSDHSLEHDGATWHFASADNKAAFMGDPEKFAPRYGGYCAYAVSKGGTAPTVPEAWTIHEDRLYLNFSLDVMGIWREDIPGNIALADANWPGVLA